MRLMHRLWAWLAGYFWLPCPVCGKQFGGHEEPTGLLRLENGEGRVTCPRCEVARRKQVAQRPHEHPAGPVRLGGCGVKECPNKRPHSHVIDLCQRIKGR